MFQCSAEEEYLPFTALCNGTNECSNGADETNAFCEGNKHYEFNIHCLFIVIDKCSLPYYGNCAHNEQCVQWERWPGVRCECSTGYTRYYNKNYDCKGNFVAS